MQRARGRLRYDRGGSWRRMEKFIGGFPLSERSVDDERFIMVLLTIRDSIGSGLMETE